MEPCTTVDLSQDRQGLPQYIDVDDSDVYILSGAEDLVPEYRRDSDGSWVARHPGYSRDPNEFWVRVTRSVLKRNENKSVQDFDMGLDFSAIPAGARLAEGAYLAVQIPETIEVLWSWDDWVYNPANGQVVNKADPQQLIPFNYVILGISRYEGA